LGSGCGDYCCFITNGREAHLKNWRLIMNKMLSTFTAVAIALAAIAPVAFTSAYAGGGLAKIEKQCHRYAKKQAKRAQSQSVVGNMVVGGLVGGLLGSAIGGKRTTIGMAGGGAALGMLNGASSYNEHYDAYFSNCMDQYLN
jgi:hypothetical protein